MRSCISGIVWLILVTPGVVAAQPGLQAVEPLIVARGEGSVRMAPDRAFVTIAAESRAPTPREAQRLNAEAMAAVQRRLRAAGVTGDAMRTLGLDLQLESDWVNGRRVTRGYVARNSLEVRVDAVDRTGEIADSAVTGGATTVSGIRFDLSQRTAAEREALRLAVVDARGRADAMATGAGRTLDRVLRIEERGVAPPPVEPMMMQVAGAGRSEATPVAPGMMEIRADVTLTATFR